MYVWRLQISSRCWNAVEPIRYGVCDVHVACRGWFVASDSLVC